MLYNHLCTAVAVLRGDNPALRLKLIITLAYHGVPNIISNTVHGRVVRSPALRRVEFAVAWLRTCAIRIGGHLLDPVIASLTNSVDPDIHLCKGRFRDWLERLSDALLTSITDRGVLGNLSSSQWVWEWHLLQFIERIKFSQLPSPILAHPRAIFILYESFFHPLKAPKRSSRCNATGGDNRGHFIPHLLSFCCRHLISIVMCSCLPMFATCKVKGWR